MAEITWDEAVRSAIRSEMARDRNVVIMAEDVQLYRKWATGLQKEFGADRVMNMPVAENGFIGMATGAAVMGKRPIVEIVMIDWITVCMDMIVNQSAKAYFVSGRQHRAPLVIKVSIGVAGPAQQSQSLHAWFLQVPGLKVVAPSDPKDAKGLMTSAIRDDSPVMFIETKNKHTLLGEVPDGDYEIPIGQGTIRREGSDVTIVAVGTCVADALNAADILEGRGISAEVLDPRSLNPIDTDLLFESVEKTHCLVAVDQGPTSGNAGNEFLALASEKGLVRGFARVAAPAALISAAKPMQGLYGPTPEKIVSAVESSLSLVRV